jgi:hypothetical protein
MWWMGVIVFFYRVSELQGVYIDMVNVGSRVASLVARNRNETPS